MIIISRFVVHETGSRLVKMNIAGCEHSFRSHFLSEELRPASQVLIYFSFLRVSRAVFHSKVSNLTKPLTLRLFLLMRHKFTDCHACKKYTYFYCIVYLRVNCTESFAYLLMILDKSPATPFYNYLKLTYGSVHLNAAIPTYWA